MVLKSPLRTPPYISIKANTKAIVMDNKRVSFLSNLFTGRLEITKKQITTNNKYFVAPVKILDMLYIL
ncbi:hypothetical protein HN451_06505 [archaeon]|nr:hypothetical protein [archaeon]